MKRSLPLATLIVLCPLIFSCAGSSGDRPGETAPSNQKSAQSWMHHYAVFRDIPYGEGPEHVLDLYQQGSWVGEPTFWEGAPDPRPMLLFIHGGGWVSRDRHVDPFFLPFVRQGWHVLSMTYRIGPGTAPAAVNDAMCALDWVVRNADEYGFDLERLVTMGASAGGHLALTTGIFGSRPGHDCYPGSGFRVYSTINWFGITDIETVERFLAETDPVFGNYALSWIGDESRVAEISAAYSPIHLLDADSPPVLTIHGTDDSVVPYDQAIVLHERLDELGIRNELLSLQGGTHAGFTDAQFQQAFEAMLAFVGAN